jgi:hypothetical protein
MDHHSDDDVLLGETAVEQNAQDQPVNGHTEAVVENHHSGSDDDDDSSVGGDEGAADGEEGAPFPEGLGKKEAKKTLSKQQYKLWKKAHSSGKKDKKDKKKDKKDKKKSSSKKDKSSSKKSGKKRGHGNDDSEDLDALLAETGEDNYVPDGEGMDFGDDHQARKRSRRERFGGNIRDLVQENITDVGNTLESTISELRQEQYVNAKNNKLTPAQKKAYQDARARELVSMMAKARMDDKNAFLSKQGAPINRLLIKEAVLEVALNGDYEEPLVKYGFLNEISYWLLDPITKGLAPLDLRSAALRILMNIGFKGSMGAVRRRKTKTTKDVDELEMYSGVCSTDLKENAAHLGKAVNFIRQNENEHPDHRNKACVLLERFSRAWADLPEQRNVRDTFQGATYEHVTTEVEAFRKTLNRVDPLDPNSYHKVPPLYLRPTPML